MCCRWDRHNEQRWRQWQKPAVLTRHQARMVARRVIAYAQVGRDPASDRQRMRSAPRFDDSWKNIGHAGRRSGRHPLWKPSTAIAAGISTMPSVAMM